MLGFKAHITVSDFPCHVLISTPKKASLKKHHNFVMNPLLYQYISNNYLILHIHIFWIGMKTKYVHCNWLLHFSLFKLTSFYPCSLSLAFYYCWTSCHICPVVSHFIDFSWCTRIFPAVWWSTGEVRVRFPCLSCCVPFSS